MNTADETKGVIRSCTSNDRQYNGKTKRTKRQTNYDGQNTTQKTKDLAT